MSDDNRDQNPSGEITALIERLSARARDRREAGEYPDHIESQLDEHFRRIVLRRNESDTSEVRAAVDRLHEVPPFQAMVGATSDMPGGEMIHKAVSRVTARYMEALASQMQVFADRTCGAIDALGNAVGDGGTHVHGDLAGRLDAVLERLDDYERSPSSNQEATRALLGDLRRRIEAIEHKLSD